LSPILVRPVREQLEHDRVIRLLQADLAKKKVEVGINPGAEQNAAVGGGSRREFPDAVLYSTEKGKKLIAVVEVETAESVNHLEAMSQWAHLARLKVPFHLYVPTASVDVARRLSQDHAIPVTEIWSYHQVGEQFRFTLIYPPPRGRAAGTPRTVSVASIRVEPRADPTVDATDRAEPVPVTPSAPGAASTKVPAAQPRVIPAKTARAAQPVKPAAVKVAAPAARPAKEATAKAPAQRAGGEAKGKTATPGKAVAVAAKSASAAKAAPVGKPAKVATRPGRAVSAASSRPSSRASAPSRPAVPPRKTSAPVRPKASPPRAKSGRSASRPAPSRKSPSKRR
jgi:hypothetical protein